MIGGGEERGCVAPKRLHVVEGEAPSLRPPSGLLFPRSAVANLLCLEPTLWGLESRRHRSLQAGWSSRHLALFCQGGFESKTQQRRGSGRVLAHLPHPLWFFRNAPMRDAETTVSRGTEREGSR